MNGDRAPLDTAPSALDSAFGALKTAPNRQILGFLLRPDVSYGEIYEIVHQPTPRSWSIVGISQLKLVS